MNKFLKYNQREPKPEERRISYSQFSMYSQCPKHWELAYAKGLRTFSQSIHTVFGTAMHETLQHYLTVMYNDSVKAADAIDIHDYLKDQMYLIYKEAVDYCESHYPETCKEFKRLLNEQYVLFCKKQKNYGPDNISVGTDLKSDADVKLSLTGLWFRINDKIQRLKQLIILGHKDNVGESETDTFQDLSVYGIIAQIVSKKLWGK